MLGFSAFSQLPLATTPISGGGAAYSITCSPGAYTYSGSSTTILRKRSLTASAGSYTYTGSSTTIKRDRVLTSLAGSYSITGQSISINRNRSLTASAGSYTYTGSNATLFRGRSLFAQSGVYAYIGSSVVLTRTGMVWPLEADVLAGVQYGPTGTEYTGTLTAGAGVKIDVGSGNLYLPIGGVLITKV